MIRSKQPDADLRKAYRHTLRRSMGVSAALNVAVLVLLPTPEFRTPPPRREVLVIQLEEIPETRQRIPPALLRLELPETEPAPAPPPALSQLDPPEVVTEFSLQEEHEVVEFWMLEKRPRVQRRVLPEYPDSARLALLEGRVSVRALLDTQGRVERLGEIAGPAVFHRAAARAARQWEFTPAVQNDRPVRVWVSIPFVFEFQPRTGSGAPR